MQTSSTDQASSLLLPPPPALHAHFQVLLSQLHSLTVTLAQSAATMRTMLVYPTPAFPLREHEQLLTTLLRKKANPEVEKWIAEAEASELNESDAVDTSTAEWNERCQWASELVEQLAAERPWNGRQTKEELDDGDMGADDDDPMRDGRDGHDDGELTTALRFMSQGERGS